MKGWVGKNSEVKGYSHTQVSINATPVSGLPGFLWKEWGGRGGAGQRRQPEKKNCERRKTKKKKEEERELDGSGEKSHVPNKR